MRNARLFEQSGREIIEAPASGQPFVRGARGFEAQQDFVAVIDHQSTGDLIEPNE
jgi:hypothetical protein